MELDIVALVAHYRMSSMKRGEEAIKGKRMSVDVANAMGTSDVELLTSKRKRCGDGPELWREPEDLFAGAGLAGCFK